MKGKNNLYLSSDALNAGASDDFQKALVTLEFDKVLERVAAFAAADSAKEAVRALAPSVSLAVIRAKLRETAEAKFYIETKGAPSFGAFKDVRACLDVAAKGGMLSMSALLDVAGVLSAAASLDGYLSLAEKAPMLEILRARLAPNKYLRDKITTAILAEDMMADNASARLFDIRRNIKLASTRIREVLSRYVSGPDSRYLQETIITQRNGRFVVPVKSEHRGDVKGLIHDTSASGSTVFIEPAQVVEANNKLRTLEAEEKAEIERVLYELSAEVDRFRVDLAADHEVLTALAVIFAKAEYAFSTGASEPVMNENKRVELLDARHPLLDKDKAVPITVTLGKGFTTLVITGPNTGGKTVTLKTVGLLALMAQSGLHIPAQSGSTLPVFDGILADIGDEQSIEQSLSTFSAHMVNIVDILRRFTPQSLILFDELGAGTDPIEGAALAQSILEKITACGALCAATTHYAELKAYAMDTPHVTNASCEFDVETLRPTYKLVIGLPGRSNAFAIASRLGIPGEIIKASKAKIDNGTRSFEGLIGKVERQRVELEKQKAETEAKLEKARAMAQEAEKKLADYNARIESENEKAAEKAKALLDRARESADLVFSELQEIQRKKDAADFKEQLEKTRDKVRASLGYASKEMQTREKLEADYLPPREYAVGDSVQMAGFAASGEIIRIDGDTVEVQMGSARIKTNKKALRLVENKDKTGKKGGRVVTPKKAMDTVSEVDVRGEICDDAIFIVDKFLDDAQVSSLQTVRIIHGKGTGALRKGLWDYLKHDKRVASIRLGNFGEGDAGVTVVTLK